MGSLDGRRSTAGETGDETGRTEKGARRTCQPNPGTTTEELTKTRQTNRRGQDVSVMILLDLEPETP
ncbi:hypothetical protein G5714_010452 [Onychostoma macrolepis]|uniref:Uncharacterized protein n=1 Tax=Onychostoma macrolepis TaxID=369639 RepID=A0A7J6CPX2_9TELE|nr:hypothetical protein G5714_010452 [Onychostoma macrolepis]